MWDNLTYLESRICIGHFTQVTSIEQAFTPVIWMYGPIVSTYFDTLVGGNYGLQKVYDDLYFG